MNKSNEDEEAIGQFMTEFLANLVDKQWIFDRSYLTKPFKKDINEIF